MKFENRMSSKRSLERELLNERANKFHTTASKLKKVYKRYKEWKERAKNTRVQELQLILKKNFKTRRSEAYKRNSLKS